MTQSNATSIDINEQIQNNFIDNIEYFQAYHSDIFNKISEFEMAVENGFYELKYELIYENDAFDLIESQTQKLFYNQDAQDFINSALQSLDYTPPKRATTKMQASTPIIEYLHAHQTQSKKLLHIHKFIFFGLGLALHVRPIDEKIHAKAYLFVENDLELFRLSMFCVNYKELAQEAQLFFSIAEENNAFDQKSQNFLAYKEYYNHSLKFVTMDSVYEPKVAQFHLLQSQTRQTTSYTTLLEELLKPLTNIFHGYKLFTAKSNLANEPLKGTPFLLISDGASLENNIEWLQQNHHTCITVVTDKALPSFQKHKIPVDIIIYLDAQDAIKSGAQNSSSFDHTLCLCKDTTPAPLLDLFPKENIFLFESVTDYIHNSLKLTAMDVDLLSYELLLRLHVKSIYLLGFDLQSTAESPGDSFEVEGNFQKKVSTNPSLFRVLQSINHASRLYKNTTQNVYNLSDGVRVQGTFPLSVEEITLPTNTRSFERLYDQLNQNIKQGFTAQELEALELKLQKAQELHAYFTKVAKKTFLVKEEYLHELERLYETITQKDQGELATVLYSYLHGLFDELFDFFNSTTVSEESVHIKALHSTLCKELINICERYISKINEER